MKKMTIEIYKDGLFINGFEIPNCSAQVDTPAGEYPSVVITCYPDEVIIKESEFKRDQNQSPGC